MSSPPFTEDALNRYRITHSDRELRPLLRRLHQLPKTSSSSSPEDSIVERQLVYLELLKWRTGIERIIGSVGNLERQKRDYERQTREIEGRTESMKQSLAKEEEYLEKARKLRDHRAKCDELVAKIRARSKSRNELDEQITTLKTSLEEQRASHAIYVQAAQARADTFAHIAKLIDECRNVKLPVDLSLATVVLDRADVVESPATTSVPPNIQLNASAAPFQPTATKASSSWTLKAPTDSSAGYALPSRPSNSPLPPSGNNRNQNSSRPGSHSLPIRPNGGGRGLSLAGQGKSRVGLEDGEVGPEEGELDERGAKRGLETEVTTRRSTRRRM
ncbi:uncharacterized protein IAS62_003928 [Cryptococcus decagattii]|uniref:THO complex subunit 7 n=1 Tax=Cryptococcus decagattii TaxID=1859122 RepID=A0ABZ2AVN2_9TREE